MQLNEFDIPCFRQSRFVPVLAFKTVSGEQDQDQVGQKTASGKEPYESPALLCRQCLAFIARPEDRIAVDGAHHHTFANPHGIVFEIGCFQQAPGCAAAGAPTDEFTWFAGHRWQVAVCGACLTHLGWRFTGINTGGGFFGLILDQLVESTRSDNA